MKFKLISLLLLSCILCVVGSGCSKENINPDDFITSTLTGEYSKDGMWKLDVSENNTPLDNYGYVRFESKNLENGDFKFVNVLPGVTEKTYKNVPLTPKEDGFEFLIQDVQGENTIDISGTVGFGYMQINITY